MSSDPISIVRGPGGEVEVEGVLDAFAVGILTHAGFVSWPTLGDSWARLPFDMGRMWENERASWAADMLTAARYQVDLDPSLRPAAARRTKTAMTAQPPPSNASRGHRR
ncbi:hypothetical protein [Streptomyces albireticuli]|uniref:Uncharacterized protein n=1 Tax=Streptomyces albireticuli TaxID=1940 RepID=A0A2A2D034_9ACTN|nr:hypothetical protein [Streptomyces albireticuli]MCD9193415.1 hypothetical protein [Streptomyces albireticuli]PAU44692.1 hypothetical protein CK936_33490 [Streptomyces albireticuli]